MFARREVVTEVYHHRQHAPLCQILYVVAGCLGATPWLVVGMPDLARITLSLSGAAVLLLAASFHYLEVMVRKDGLKVGFGPLPLFCLNVQIDDIQKVEMGRTTLLDGWGIHWSPGGGWLWNLWGRDCVVLRLRSGMLRIGSDDAANLARAVATRLRTGTGT